MRPLLAAEGLRYAYAMGGDVLDGLSVSFAAGGRHAVLGSNGSGKSTLLLALNGSLKPGDGVVRLDGEELGYRRRERNLHRRRVGLVLQDPDDQLFSASVAEDVSFGPFNLGLSEAEVTERVAAVLDELELTELADRPAHLLSYGQRKRVAIAGVVAMRPEVLLLDEPLAGLDPVARGDVVDTLDRLHAAGTTLVATTHDVDWALAWADTATVVDGGAVLASGPAVDVLGRSDVVERARLRRPSVLALAEALTATGTAAVPSWIRTVDDLCQWLRSG